ncbi:isoprenylcysteine carboxylmethyltransferase family protein [Mucilaginibacter defluvii]|uniref:isoprenylcysteine carboxylmethyltransferase family protein n=1 Tax=Mucilaginibacter defluvii TaxID=1196019 RepID=UPI0031E57673
MNTFLFTTFFAAISFRIASMIISIINERRLLSLGAREFDQRNSRRLIFLHLLFYIVCAFDGWYTGHFLETNIGLAGLCLYCFSIIALYYVIYTLGHIWTVKLIIAPEYLHHLNTGRFFRFFRHPNYYLSVIPELIAIAMIFHAYWSFLAVFPLYMATLITRIRREENVMKQFFPNY